MNFRDFITEALKNKFNISLYNETVELIRNGHLRIKRGKSVIPKDAWMSKNKYEKILEIGLKHVDPMDFTLTWTNNNFSFAISGSQKSDTQIVIFGAIMKSKNAPEKLYKLKGANRYHLGEILF